MYYGAFPKGMAFFLFAVKRPCLFIKTMAANKQGRLRSNKKGAIAMSFIKPTSLSFAKSSDDEGNKEEQDFQRTFV